MMTVYQIPLTSSQQTFTIALSGATYQIVQKWVGADQGGWTIDLLDSVGSAIISGIPLVTGANLLAQYEYIGIPGALRVYNSVDGVTAPTFDDIGSTTNLYYVTP